MTAALAAASPRRRRMIDDMTLRNLLPATLRSYLRAVTNFSRYFGRPPDTAGFGGCPRLSDVSGVAGVSWPALDQTVVGEHGEGHFGSGPL
jgi:hypothetical protein